MIPVSFEPITLDRQHAYLSRLAACTEKTSDYSFSNIWGWAEEFGLVWAWDDPIIWLKQTKPHEVYWAPVGPWEAIAWNRYLLDPALQGKRFIRVPEALAKLWEEQFAGRLQLEEARGHWDYLYDVSELVTLKGNRFHKKKNLLNQFIKKYAYAYSPLGPDQIDRALSLQSDWCTWRDCENLDTLGSENRAIQRILTHWKDLADLMGGTLSVEDRMVAYTVAERLTDSVVLIHFEKANPDYRGAYQAINQMFLAHNEHAFKSVNREQDLDDEGLRNAKLSYHPVGFMHKYQVTIT